MPSTYPPAAAAKQSQTEDSFGLFRQPRHRQIFCNRTLNMRQVEAIGYDMDYTLVHYHTEVWEARAYELARAKLAAQGWPVENLSFVPDLVVRGLIIDTERGNIIKANSFGYVKYACHGTKPLALDTQRELYAREVISLSNRRYVFMNTLFSLSEACLYAQLIDVLDGGHLPAGLNYSDLYVRVRDSIDEAHVEGQLKAETVASPELFLALDPEVPLALLDQHHANKRLVLITNSAWSYTQALMTYAFDRFLPGEMTWRDLFDLVITSAQKPHFFTQRPPLFEVASDDGLLRPVPVVRAGSLKKGTIYEGGNAAAVETSLGLAGDKILYVGDHLYGDVNVSKQVLRWRTALILRELEADLAALDAFAQDQDQLESLMRDKETLEYQVSSTRLAILRRRNSYAELPEPKEVSLAAHLTQLRAQLDRLDESIRPLAVAASRLSNPMWGPLMRTGNDKSHLARQVERYADIYTSRVSNFVQHTPFAYLRSLRGSLPHDPTSGPSVEGS